MNLDEHLKLMSSRDIWSVGYTTLHVCDPTEHIVSFEWEKETMKFNSVKSMEDAIGMAEEFLQKVLP